MVSSFNRSASQLLNSLTTTSSNTSPVTLEHDPTTLPFTRTWLSDQPKTNFHSRMKTFKNAVVFDLLKLSLFELANWVGKPCDVSPLVCSKYGWVCVEKDLLQCVSCKAYLSDCEMNPDLNEETATRDLRVRCEQLKSVDLRGTNISTAQFPACIGADALEQLAQLFNASPEIVIIAASGWQVGTLLDTLECCHCLRTIGLWLFPKKRPHNDSASIFDCSPSRKRARLDQNNVEEICLNKSSEESNSTIFCVAKQILNETIIRLETEETVQIEINQPK